MRPMTTEQQPATEPPVRPLRVVDEPTRVEGGHRPRSSRAPDPLHQSGVFPKLLTEPFEPTLVDVRLTLDLDAVDRALAGAAYDPSMAAPTMRERLQEMREIEESLARIHALSMHDDLAPLFGPETALSRYMRGVQGWCASFARICARLASDLGAGRRARWPALCTRVAAAAKSHHRGLRTPAIDAADALSAAGPRWAGRIHERLRIELEQLFSAIDWFEESTRRYITSPETAA